LFWAAEAVTSVGLLSNEAGTFTSDEWLETLTGLESAYPAIFITTAVLFVAWSYGAHSNLRHLGRADVRHEDQATIWWWLVPFANLVLPFRVMFETSRGSTAPANDAGWRQSRLPAAAGWWTALLLAGLATTNVGSRMITESLTLSEFETSLQVSLAGELAMIGAAVAAVLMIKKIVIGQESLASSIGLSAGGSAQSTNSPVGPRQLTSEQQDETAAYCVNCGSVIAEGDRYCSGCGISAQGR
jgi:hypothetical protein